MNGLMEKERIVPMSPLEAEGLAYWSSNSYYVYKAMLEQYKDNVDLWHLQQYFTEEQ